MIVWSVANQKGGVGKTTTTITLAGLLLQQNKRVLVIDTDPHASLTIYLNFDPENLPHSLFNLFHLDAIKLSTIKPLIVETAFENLHLIPAHMSLATLDRAMGTHSGMGLVLKKALACLQQEYDYVLIDCPPILGVMMVNALAASQRVLIPVQTEYLAMKGLERMITTLNIMQKSRSSPFNICIVPTMYDKRTRASLEALKELKQKYQEKIWNSAIPIDTKFRDASLKHMPPSLYAKNTRGVFAYRTLLFYLEHTQANEHQQ